MPVTKHSWWIAMTLVVAGCSTSTDSGIGIGSGQTPDPVVLDFPIAYVKRALPIGTEDLREQRTFQAGADLWLRDRASPQALERNITATITGGLWDVRDVDVSMDGTKLVFAMRPPLIVGAMESEQPTWNIWEYDRTTDTLRRVISSDLVAEEGHDIDPAYLPDGRIVFSSTRQRQSKAVLIDEGKPQFAALDEDRNEHGFVLHVMAATGTAIRQITFNQSHDLEPAVLNDGRIVFSRWENASGSSIHLYTVRPDGGGLELLYGANSHATGSGPTAIQFMSPRVQPDGRVIVLARPFMGTDEGGDPLRVDAATYVEISQPVLASAGMSGPAQLRMTINDVRTEPGVSPGGRYSSVFPLWDGTNRLMVSWSQCRLLELNVIVACTPTRLANPAAVAAPPLYGVWIYDPNDGTQRPMLSPVEGLRFDDVVAMAPRTPAPPVVLDAVPGLDYDPILALENVGIINIRSVYDLDGVDSAPGGIVALRDPRVATAAQRPARFLRIEKAVSLPDDEVRDFRNSAFGVAGGLGMREIIGYAPIEPDGSVQVKVPAGIAFALGVLDENGRRRTPRHLNWMQVRAGEVLHCDGCHVPAAQQPAGVPRRSHGRSALFASVNPGAPTMSAPFPATQAALSADLGESMAETRARISCQTDCAAQRPSVDVVFDDPWTDPVAAGRAADAPFSYRYSNLLTLAPTSGACQTRWEGQCRSTIHYPNHLQPLWSLPRIILDVDGVTVLEDRTCLACHSPADGAGVVRVPASQLDLSGIPSPEQADHFVSYRELLFTDNAQEVNMGALQDILVPGPIDPVTGLPTLVPVPVAPSMTGAGARASNRFFSRFDAGGSHAGFLNTAELRLISEWLDIGGQYYNDPFMAPVN